jgi:hypothetical protein
MTWLFAALYSKKRDLVHDPEMVELVSVDDRRHVEVEDARDHDRDQHPHGRIWRLGRSHVPTIATAIVPAAIVPAAVIATATAIVIAAATTITPFHLSDLACR